MPRPSFVETNRWVLGPDDTAVEEVPDELFLVLHDGEDTSFLARTSYGQAVLDCLTIEDECFLLKVWPGWRRTLCRELNRGFRSAYVYHFAGGDSRRFLLTDMVFVRFNRRACESIRKLCCHDYFRDVDESIKAREGIHRWNYGHRMEPLSAWELLELERPIKEAFPVVIDIPAFATQPLDADLTTAPGSTLAENSGVGEV